jgi:predicted metalloprotease with PDZ domain
MTHYTISALPEKNLLEITLQLETHRDTGLELKIPAWRPGRYELQNYARNILSVYRLDEQGNRWLLPKKDRNTWLLPVQNQKTTTVIYQYFARQMDAGGSWVDAELWYINFVNCLLYSELHKNLPCSVQLDLPEALKPACALPFENKTLQAANYFELADSPFLANRRLLHLEFVSYNTRFHIHIQGHILPDLEKWQTDFQQFTEAQGNMMGGFPFPDYHFLIQILPYRFYHGVEHRHSTVIVIGTDETDRDGQLVSWENVYKYDLLGICSHELFHVWNICRIRPAEFISYDLSKEVYFNTGYVVEGITTYYGDLFLVRSGVWTAAEFFAELCKTLNKHFNTSDYAGQSLLASSFDLWVDGYNAGVPDKKVSVYHKGCLVALLLDLKIRQITENKQSLDDVMRALWQQFGDGLRGYTHLDFVQTAEKAAGVYLADFFHVCISTNASLLEKLKQQLAWAGCEVEAMPFGESGTSVQIRRDMQANPAQQHNFQNWLHLQEK